MDWDCPCLGEEGSVGESRRTAALRTGRVAVVAVVGILGLIASVSTAAPASASSNIGVFVGYADSARGWPAADLAPGADLIVTQLQSGPAAGCTGPTPNTLDTSDIGPNGSSYAAICVPDGIQPTVDITVDNVTTTYTDSGQVLNTGGIDAGSCTGNESIQWTAIGHTPCPGSLVSLVPPTQTHPVLSTATVTATFTNSCGQPLSNTVVNFSILSGPNTGGTGSGVTDANGQASFSYSSSKIGTDALQASVTNLAGSINSTSVTATWTVGFAPGGGAFVIWRSSSRAGLPSADQ